MLFGDVRALKPWAPALRKAALEDRVNHRHLLPEEIDLLLDGEVGFGVQPLRAHARQCSECRARLDDARAVTAALEQLPHFTPPASFADGVMSRVHVFEPAHVAAADTIRRLVPRSHPTRVLLGALAASVGFVLTAASVLLITQLDLMALSSGVVIERGREALSSMLAGALGRVIGEPAVGALLQRGGLGLAAAAAAVLGTAVLAALALRALVDAASRRRI